MIRKEDCSSIIEICPIRNVVARFGADDYISKPYSIRNVVARFGNKWSLIVLLIINDSGTVRFNELCRMIPDISTRVLSGTLRTLEADGLIDRKVYAQVPPKVEYQLTDTGKSLVPIIHQRTDWALANMKNIISHRTDYESAQN